MNVRAVTAALAAIAIVTLAVDADASPGPLQGYDGHLPFRCRIQHVGTGTHFPHPAADPFCVEYDKTHQNVDRLGVVDFLSHEPARLAVAADKCFYFQRDHWRSAVVQSDESTEVYNWDGDYWWDKAIGAFGLHADHFTVNNRSVDPASLPGFPPAWKRYFGWGRGGIEVTGTIPVDPTCRAKATHGHVYR